MPLTLSFNVGLLDCVGFRFVVQCSLSGLAVQEQVDVDQCKGIFPYGLPIVEVSPSASFKCGAQTG